ncbi:MAG: gamma-glutamyltransferase [Ardenticatenaceae bacterium]|nr:gamma-glutamyltransferase [Ardenticatenaceae bacterium]HBY97657.1 gamma-glutamyltransferase [Chloroflexota bacterium]
MTDKGQANTGAGGMRSVEGSPTPNVFPPPESMRPTLVGSRYMVSAGHPIVAQVAALVLEQGGTAIDAGVAGGITSNVVQVDMANFGGIAPTLVRMAGSDKVYSVAGVGTWGSDATIQAFRERFGDDMPLGGAVALVPSAPAAWITTLARFGTWSFRDAAGPAIVLARDGFPLDQRTARALRILGGGFSQWGSSRVIYWPSGRPPEEGEWLRQPKLAALLQWMADAEVGADRAGAFENVRRSFYEGEVARRIVEFVRADGGWLTLDDLAGFEAEVGPAPSYRYHGYRVYTTPTWTQGAVLLQALSILAGCDLERMGHNSADYIHFVIEALKVAFSERERYYGDPRFVEIDLDWLLSDGHADQLRGLIRQGTALPNLPTLERKTKKRYDTTYLCVVDGAGNVFSSTPSDTLDGGPIIPELGIIVSPRGVQSRLDPAHPSALAPGKRPVVTPAPALALGEETEIDHAVWAFGCPGGDMIIQAMLQAFLNRLHFDMSPQQAVEAARVATFSFPVSFFPNVEVSGRLSLEGRIPEQVRESLKGRGHNLYVWPDYEFDAGGVTMALDLKPPSREGRVLAAAADPRRICYAVGC